MDAEAVVVDQHHASFTPSCTAVTISDDIISYEPSPTMTKTSRSGSAILTPRPPAIS